MEIRVKLQLFFALSLTFNVEWHDSINSYFVILFLYVLILYAMLLHILYWNQLLHIIIIVLFWCVFAACVENNITRLVYTSTYNTVFGGQTIENGDESLEFLPLDKVGYSLWLEWFYFMS